MDTNPAGSGAQSAVALRKTWKDNIGWAGFVVTAGILIQQVYMHGSGVWWFFMDGASPLSELYRKSVPRLLFVLIIYWIVKALVFTLYSLVMMAFLFLRKKAVPGLLMGYASAAIFANIGMEVLNNLFMAMIGVPLKVKAVTVVSLAAAILMIVFWAKSKRFRALFIL